MTEVRNVAPPLPPQYDEFYEGTRVLQVTWGVEIPPDSKLTIFVFKDGQTFVERAEYVSGDHTQFLLETQFVGVGYSYQIFILNNQGEPLAEARGPLSFQVLQNGIELSLVVPGSP